MKYLLILTTLIFASCSDQPEYIEMTLDSSMIRPVDTIYTSSSRVLIKRFDSNSVKWFRPVDTVKIKKN